MDNYGLAIPRIQSDDEDEVVRKTIQLFWQLHTWRSNFAEHWEEVAQLILPEYSNTFQFGSFNFPGQKRTERQIDATGMLALQRFAAICDSLLTPANMRWHALGTNNPYLNKSRKVALYFEEVTNILFQHRYAPHANFMGQNHANYLHLGAFGTHAMFIDEWSDPVYNRKGIRYRSIPLGELFLYQNHQGQVCGFIRWFRLTAQQAWDMFGAERFPENLRSALEQQSQHLYNFLHHVGLREDWEPGKLSKKGKPWRSDYICMDAQVLLSQGGYRSFPLGCGRYVQGPDEVYGRSPAMMVLPALKTLNAEKRTFLKQAHRAADPVLLINDDGLLDGFDLRPGSLNKGGVSADGRPLVHILPTGDIQVSKEMMDEERTLINDAFLVTLFQILTESPTMTATEVIERTNEKGILLAPTVGRQQSEYLGSIIDREIDILSYQNLLPEMPPELKEAKGSYEVVYTSPLSRAMRAQEAAGAMRTIESALTIANATQDPSVMDVFDFDTMIPAIAEIQSVPESWMADPRKVMAKRAERAEALKRQQQIQALPAMAALQNARAKAQIEDPNQAGVGGGALQPAPQGEPSFSG